MAYMEYSLGEPDRLLQELMEQTEHDEALDQARAEQTPRLSTRPGSPAFLPPLLRPRFPLLESEHGFRPPTHDPGASAPESGHDQMHSVPWWPPKEEWLPLGFTPMMGIPSHPLDKGSKLPRAWERDKQQESQQRLPPPQRRLFGADFDDAPNAPAAPPDLHPGPAFVPDPGLGPSMAAVQQRLSGMSGAEARRRFAPAWAFVAWEADPPFLADALQLFFARRRWPSPAHLPPRLRARCLQAGVDLQELFVSTPFAPNYMAVLKDMAPDLFDRAIDQFFSDTTWIDVSQLPPQVVQACYDMNMDPGAFD